MTMKNALLNNEQDEIQMGSVLISVGEARS
jgi:hypothetical protein